MSKQSRYFACVLAGGSGERFWPMSRSRTPKHLLKLLSDRTLLEETVRRLEGVVPWENVFVLTSEAQVQDVRSVLSFLPAGQVIAEPARRDTAPAAALASALVYARDPGGVLALFPADAFIPDPTVFRTQARAAFEWAEASGSLVTVAIKPTYPATGFGYLELGDELSPAGSPSPVRRVTRFVEKPSLAAAEGYLASGRYAWNAGMFTWTADAFLKEASRQAPELGSFIRDFPRQSPEGYIRDRFPLLPKISVDYAIMEKALSVATLVAAFDWDDVGLWTAVPRHLPKDPLGNAVRGPVVAVESTGNIAVSNGRVIALCGVKDLVVVETADAILVCHKDSVQDIKKLHALLPKEVL